MVNPEIILASTSPRRKELLFLLGFPFQVVPPTSNEATLKHETPEEHVRRLALKKANSVAHRYTASLVIGSDTVIELDGSILGKPENLKEAQAMLTQLRGRCHLVHTGLALVCGKRQIQETCVETVKVWMKDFSDSVLSAYLQTQDSLGKAGAYSIQGEAALLIEKIAGDYPAVVGLPLWHTAKLLEKAGMVLPVKVEEIYKSKPYANWKDFG